ncbi:MAG: hypothetical protein KY434_03875 [Actinobacteria bacterium]|nr:hypothetical protein [Actinomycetota bacterium]
MTASLQRLLGFLEELDELPAQRHAERLEQVHRALVEELDASDALADEAQADERGPEQPPG